MPPPGSFIDISPIPFSITVTQADFNAGTFGGIVNECWFKYTTADPICLGEFINEGGTFKADVTYYESDGTTTIAPLNNGANNASSYVVLRSADDYYIKITRHGGGASDFDFATTWNTLPIITGPDVPQGALVINDDTSGFPATVMDSDGNLLGVLLDVPAGEVGAILPNGFSLWFDAFNTLDAVNQLALFDNTWTYVASYDTIGGLSGSQPLIAADDNDFWIYDPNDRTLNKLTTGGVVTQETSDIGVGNKVALGIARDGSIAYYSKGRFDGIIYAYDIPGDAPLSNLYAVPGFVSSDDTLAMTLNNNPGEILVLADDSIITWWHDLSGGTTYILNIASDGSLINSFPYLDSIFGLMDHLQYGRIDPTTEFTAWFQTTDFSIGTYYSVAVADGSLTTITLKDMFSAGVNIRLNSANLFGPSESCILLVFLTAAPAVATLTVIKITNPAAAAQVFDFTTTGGLSPSTFSLSDGGYRVYNDLAPGTYGVTEDPVLGWTTEYDVTNGDPHDAIELAGGDNVAVTVTNTQVSASLSGIYKIVPGKRNDTLWIDVNTGETEVVKIP